MSIDNAVKFFEKAQTLRKRAARTPLDTAGLNTVREAIEIAEGLERQALGEVIAVLALGPLSRDPARSYPTTERRGGDYPVTSIRGCSPGAQNTPRWIATLQCDGRHEVIFEGFPKPEDVPLRAPCARCDGLEPRAIRPSVGKGFTQIDPTASALMLADAVRAFLFAVRERDVSGGWLYSPREALSKALVRYEAGSSYSPAHAGTAVHRKVYTVAEGDTLSGIGERFGVSWEMIAKINRIADTSMIHPGWHLIIPDKIEVRS